MANVELTVPVMVAKVEATTWVDLEDITINIISQSQKEKHCMIPLRGGP